MKKCYVCGKERDIFNAAWFSERPLCGNCYRNGVRCQNCNNKIVANERYCGMCGYEINPPKKITYKLCDKCNAEYDLKYEYCQKDGSKLVVKERIEAVNGMSNDSSNRLENIKNHKETISHDEKKEKNKELSLNWFYFYTYVRIPLGIILIIISMVNADTLGNSDNWLVYQTFLIIFFSILFYHLHFRNMVGWGLNWIALLLDCMLIPLQRGLLIEELGGDFGSLEYITGVGVGLLIWFLPNYFYFMKRRVMFK